MALCYLWLLDAGRCLRKNSNLKVGQEGASRKKESRFIVLGDTI
jgi:hypothetical protein